jgi:hypothetical protein
VNDVAKSRKQRLRACERALAEHMEEFVKVGLALKEIRDDKLYREDGYETFEDYCKRKWDFSDRYARYVVGAAELRLKLPEPPPPEPETGTACSGGWTEGSVRQLGRLGSDTKAKAVAERVVKEVKEKKAAGEKVKLGSVVRKHVDAALGTGGPKRKPGVEDLPDFSEVAERWLAQVEAMAEQTERLAAGGDALERFARKHSRLAKDLAEALARMSKAWEVTKPPPGRAARVVEGTR